MTATYFTLVPGLSPCPERTHWGFLPTAAVSSHSPSRQPEQLLFSSPKAVKAAGRPAVYRRQLPGRGLRERGTLGERPGGCALPAPPAGEEPWCRRARTRVRWPETHSLGSPSAKDARSLQKSVRLCKVLCVNIPSR